MLDPSEGLVGDRWSAPQADAGRIAERRDAADADERARRPRRRGRPERWALAGDQLYVDFDISVANLPAGHEARAGLGRDRGDPEPHTGCVKFHARFGGDAHRFVNTKTHRHLRLRGLNAKVVEPGTVSTGDTIRKL